MGGYLFINSSMSGHHTELSSSFSENMSKKVLLVALILTVTAPVLGAQSFKALVAPITQVDPSTFLYTITLNQKEKLVIDIESPFSWHHCPKAYARVPCRAKQCAAAQPSQPRCPSHSLKSPCLTSPSNPITNTSATSYLIYTNVSIAYTDGHNPLTKTNYKFYISCAPKSLLKSRVKHSSGFASLSNGSLSLISQFSNAKIPKKFGMCLGKHGVAFIGEGPFFLLPPPGRNVTQMLRFTPFLKHPADSLGYYIGFTGISINGVAVKLVRRLLPLDKLVKLSTVTLYTMLRSDLYKAVLRQFAYATRGIPRVPKVAPFGLCLNTSNLGSTRVGLPVPQIDLQLIKGGNWTIFPANSMVQISNDLHCLGLVNSGKRAKHAIVIGSHQMQHNFLHFDLVRSRLGFSSLLFFFQTTCSNFNFTMGAV